MDDLHHANRGAKSNSLENHHPGQKKQRVKGIGQACKINYVPVYHGIKDMKETSYLY